MIRVSSPRVAVATGLGVVSPIGVGRSAFLEALFAGTSGTRRISLFDCQDFPCRVGAEVKIPEEDLRYPINGKDLKIAQRASRFALAAASEALEDAQLDWTRLSLDEQRRFGVWVGTGGGGVAWAENQYEVYFREGWRKTSVFGVLSALVGMVSSDLSMAFGARGPSHVLSTGCTSSSDAIGYAAQAIVLGQVDLALAGGTEAPLRPGIFSNFCRMKAMSTDFNETPHRASRPFDRSRDGFVLGEGAYFVVLEDLDSALRREAKPYAGVAGYASTCDAFHRTRNEPSGEESAQAVLTALAMAGSSPAEVGYVSLHGSGTPLNDTVETKAMKRVFGERALHIPMSALKSQIGHPQGAAGSAGVVATLLALRHGFVPATINLEDPDPECDLDYVPLRPRPQSVDVAVVNCISFGSKNSALVLARNPVG